MNLITAAVLLIDGLASKLSHRHATALDDRFAHAGLVEAEQRGQSESECHRRPAINRWHAYASQHELRGDWLSVKVAEVVTKPFKERVSSLSQHKDQVRLAEHCGIA